MSAPMKICRKCNAEFQGRNCDKCAIARAAAWGLKNRERKNAINAAYRVANPEKVKASNAKYRASHADKIKSSDSRYRSENKDAIRGAQYAWAAENKEKVAVMRKAWRAANPQKVQARNNRVRDVITNSYISGLLKLPVSVIPQELIELKRVQLEITRKLRELKK